MSAEQPAVGEWFACLHVDSTGSAFEALWRGNLLRDVGTKEEAAGAARQWGGEVVRVLPDGAHEAAIAQAHKRARAEAFAAAAKAVRDTYDDLDERNMSIDMGNVCKRCRPI